MADKDAIHLLLSLLLPAAAPARIPLVSSTGSGTDENGRRCDTEEDDARRWQWWWRMGSVSCDEIHAGKPLRTAVDAAGDESVSLQSQGRSGFRKGEIVSARDRKETEGEVEAGSGGGAPAWVGRESNRGEGWAGNRPSRRQQYTKWGRSRNPATYLQSISAISAARPAPRTMCCGQKDVEANVRLLDSLALF